MTTQTLDYRPDIDCLRAVAVLAVIGFHWQLGLPGGYVGVDIFFVISGYLITSIIAADIARDRFSFANFYARRIRRIVPPLYALLAFLLIASWFVLLPADYANLFQETIATAGFVSNVLFWLQTGYFERIAAERPLLHTWSLSVEEQFYLLFPVSLWLLLRRQSARSPGFARTVLLAVTIASFALNAYQVPAHPTAAFFLAPGRAWEFLTGTLLALGIAAPPRTARTRSIAVGLGGAMLLLATVSFRASTPFPGINALFPCLGTALIIWAGEGSARGAHFRFVEWGAAVGRVSYSLYLWHWPAFVYAKLCFGEINALMPLQKTLMLTFVALASVVSYRYLEMPIRRRRWLPSQRSLFAAAAAATVLLVVPAVIGLARAGFPGRFPPEVLRLASYVNYDYREPFRAETCFLSPEQTPADYKPAQCWPAKGSHEKLVLLWGDSHAAHYVAGLEQLFAGTPFRLAQATASSCPPIFDWNLEARAHCRAFNDMVRERIRTDRPDYILLSANWPAILKTNSDAIAPLQRTIAELAPRVPVGLIGPSMAFSERLPVLLTQPNLLGGTIDPRQHLDPDLDRVEALLSSQFEQWGAYFSVLREACAGKQCPLVVAGAPLVWDRAHLTAEGSVLVIARLTSLQRWLCRGMTEPAAFCRAAGS